MFFGRSEGGWENRCADAPTTTLYSVVTKGNRPWRTQGPAHRLRRASSTHAFKYTRKTSRAGRHIHDIPASPALVTHRLHVPDSFLPRLSGLAAACPPQHHPHRHTAIFDDLAELRRGQASPDQPSDRPTAPIIRHTSWLGRPFVRPAARRDLACAECETARQTRSSGLQTDGVDWLRAQDA